MEMETAKRRNLKGDFRGEALGPGRWRFTTPGQPGVSVLLHHAGLERLPAPSCAAIALEWDDGGVLVTLVFADAAQTFRAGGASICEPQDTLYSGLPLARFDGRARAFWRRVFLLSRVPGGAALLRMVARRARSANS
jgi:hypothetical protein